jgi:hypothetical protein
MIINSIRLIEIVRLIWLCRLTRELVMEFLLTEGLVEVAEAFAGESLTERN